MLETARRMEEKREADLQLMVRTIRRHLGDGVVEIQKVLTAFYVKHTSRETGQDTIIAIVPSVHAKNMAIRSYGFCSFRKAYPEIHRFFKSENISFEDNMDLY